MGSWSSSQVAGTWRKPRTASMKSSSIGRTPSRLHSSLQSGKDVESGKVWHLDFHPHQQNFNKSDSGFCRSSMQHGNSIVTSFRAVECEIPTDTGSSLS
ncbi:hypothetical protein F2Q70_00005166 [Brassica cretica]|uniref:Uncharacterized protein n=1 Tax=Brassica cretica TaxID=69181 RepID=A0A8S9J309_BRACR|nr:hypothetical protein F2Q70_00005166 [Brassica cretica]